ncbi:hypothetical protein M3Y96_00447200 [Aphelenchoides besseyi]|nr:hypothetical protein M3Y96_00447200 [Aphelenchoides besseyi]
MMKVIVVAFVLFVALSNGLTLQNRAIKSLKRAINQEALNLQQQFYSCVQWEGVHLLKAYLKVKYNPRKQKSTIVANHEKVVNLLKKGKDTQACINTYEIIANSQEEKIDQKREEDRKKLKGKAAEAFEKINKILDDGSLTMAQERIAVNKILKGLKASERSDLSNTETLSLIDQLVSTEDPYDYAAHDLSGNYPCLSSTVKKLNLEFLYFCLRLDDRLDDYWKIEKKSGLTMREVWKKEQAFFKELIKTGKNGACYENFLDREEERRSFKYEERERLAAQMKGNVLKTYKKINAIRDDLKLTIDEHIEKVKKLLQSISLTDRNELFNIVPEIKRFYNAGKYSYL